MLIAHITVSYTAALVRSNVLNGLPLDDALLERAAQAWYDLVRVH